MRFVVMTEKESGYQDARKDGLTLTVKPIWSSYQGVQGRSPKRRVQAKFHEPPVFQMPDRIRGDIGMS